MLQGLREKAEAEEQAGAYAAAIDTYRILFKATHGVPFAEEVQMHCRLASCFMQTGQYQAVWLIPLTCLTTVSMYHTAT